MNINLTQVYSLVNEQAEQLTQMPEGKIKILGNIFKALPSDDSTNPKELIRELIRAGKVDALKQKRLSQEEVQRIQELREQGKTQREIAEEIGIAHQAVDYQLAKNDKCQILPDPTPSYLEPVDDKAFPISEVLGSNVIKAPVEFKKPDPIPDDDDDEGVGGSNL